MNKSITRRIIALIFAFSGAGVLVYLSLQNVPAALTALISIVGIVIGFYFGAKANQI